MEIRGEVVVGNEIDFERIGDVVMDVVWKVRNLIEFPGDGKVVGI